MAQHVSAKAAVKLNSGSLASFAQLLRASMAGAGAVALWLTGLWLHVAPTFEAQHQEIRGVIVALIAFEIAYLCLVKNWMAGKFAKRQFSKEAAQKANANVTRALRITPILILVSFLPYFFYQARMNQATTVEGAKLIAEAEQEVSPRAAEFLSQIRTPLARVDLLRLSEDYIASLGARAPSPAQVRERAPGPIVFGWELVALAACSMALATLAFGWVATLEQPDHKHPTRKDSK